MDWKRLFHFRTAPLKALLVGATIIASQVAVPPVEAVVQKKSFTTSKGLKVKFLVDETMDFIHAELLVFYKGKFTNPAVPALTFLNLFDSDVNKSGSSLMSMLKRMGNDYEVEQTAEYLAFKINFLPDKLQQFVRFVKGVYSYKPLQNLKINPDSYTYRKRERETTGKFEDSVKNYWKYFYRRQDWKRDIAYQIAFSTLFKGSVLGRTLVTKSALEEASLPVIRNFYHRVFRLPNSLLIIKGNFRPHLTRAYISGEFTSFKQQVPEVPVQEDLQINNKRTVIVYDNINKEPPVIFWFEAIEPLNRESHIPMLVLNNILFGFPLGRIYLSARSEGFNTGNMEISSEINNQEKLSVICNTIYNLRSRDIERFVHLADRERKRLVKKKIERTEYLNVLSYLYGKIEVNSGHFDNDINHEILLSFYPFGKGHFLKSNAQSQQFVTFTKHIEKTKNIDSSSKGVIVIVGNYDMIRDYIKSLNPVVYNYKR